MEKKMENEMETATYIGFCRGLWGLLSKLLVSPLRTPIVLPYIIPYITPFKEFRL